MMVKSSGKLALSVLVLAWGAGCGDGSDPAENTAGSGGGGNNTTETPTLKVASSWFSASEQEALNVTLAAFKAQTGANVEVVALKQSQAERTAQYQANDWDVGQENFYALAGSFADGNGGLTALDLSGESELSEGLAKVFPQVRSALTVAGQIVGLPMNLHRENTLHYSKSLMPTPPTTLAQLKQVCDTYVAGGKTGPKPLAIAKGDWLYRILFEAMLPAPVVAGTEAAPRPYFVAAADVIQHYRDSECLWIAPEEHGWAQAAQAVIDGDAMMMIHGDWAKGYMVQLGWKAGVDFDVVPAPGSEGAFYYGIDTFAVNKSSPRKALAVQFAKIALSNAVQAGFSEKKGSTPGIVFEDPEHAFTDPSLKLTYSQLSAGLTAGTALPVPPWMGSDGGPLMVPLRDGEKNAEETATAFMSVYPTSN
jgi:ABC-type glycerol-3-phosphate transport system substrate-binding protein